MLAFLPSKNSGSSHVQARARAAPAPRPHSPISIEHVWVKTRINGNWYVFDPSYKPRTVKSGIDLATAAGYNASHYLASAQSGATVGTDYVQNINRNNIRFNLEKYAGILAGRLRTYATLDDVLGGKTIVPLYGALRQTSLPYQNTA